MKGLLLGLISTSLASAVPRDEHVQPVELRRGCQVSDNGSIDATYNTALRSLRRQTIPSNFTVAVNIHLASTEAYKDLITDAVVEAQWQVLHDTYAQYGINLVLNSTERVVDNLTGSGFLVQEESGWVSYQDEYNDYLKSTRKGGYDAMNLYFYAPFTPGATGDCNFPTVITDTDSLDFYKDSCQISALTMPGVNVTEEEGGFDDWNLGHLAVHEAGHWFGLNHTFAGGCSTTSPGDYVADTPAQRFEVYGCPTNSDTCPDLPGLDPIHNFMGYADDSW